MANGYRASWLEHHRGLGYWGKRLGNECGANEVGKHKAGKVKTKRMERQAERELLYAVRLCYGRIDPN